MKITQTVHEVIRTEYGATRPGRQTITIELDASDDPHGNLTGLFSARREPAERAVALLTAYAGGEEFWDLPADEVRHMLTPLGFVGQMVEGRLSELLYAARDTHGISWRTLSALTEIPTTTVRRRVAKCRQQHADCGFWRDSAGLHKGTLAEASAALAARSESESDSDD